MYGGYTGISQAMPGQGKNIVYNIFLHEIGHALGIGSLWQWTGTQTAGGVTVPVVMRSLRVGAGDTSTNTLYNSTSANLFYTNLNTGSTRANTDLGNQTYFAESNKWTYAGDARYSAAHYYKNTSTTSIFVVPTVISRAVTEYNAAFGLSLTAIPIENQGGSGSFGSHWDEGTSINESTGNIFDNNQLGNDIRNYYGNTPAPAMGGELMSPQAEGPGVYMPLSRITLGSLEDLGYTVSYAEADVYLPRDYVVRFIDTNSNLKIGFYTNNISTQTLQDSWNGISGTGNTIKIRRGITYSFHISTIGTNPVKLTTDSSGVTLVTDGVNNNNITNGTITYTPPNTLTPNTVYWLYASSNARARVFIS